MQDYPFVKEYGLGGGGSPAPTITNCTQGAESIKTCMLWGFGYIFKILIWFAGAAAVIMFVLAGIGYITQPQKAQDNHKKLIWGVVGLIVALSAFGIVKAIESGLTKGVSFEKIESVAVQFIAGNSAYAQVSNPLQDFSPPSQAKGGWCDAKSILQYAPFKSNGVAPPKGLLEKCVLGFLGLKVLPVVYTFSLFFTVAIITWMGYEYATSKGEVSALHKKLLWAIMGVIITVLAYGIVKALEKSLTGS